MLQSNGKCDALEATQKAHNKRIKAVYEWFKDWIGKVSEVIETVKTTTKSMINKVKQNFTELKEDIVDFIKDMLSVTGLFSKEDLESLSVASLITKITDLISDVKDLADDLTSFVGTQLKNALAKAGDLLEQLTDDAKEYANDKFEEVKEEAKEEAKAIGEDVKNETNAETTKIYDKKAANKSVEELKNKAKAEKEAAENTVELKKVDASSNDVSNFKKLKAKCKAIVDGAKDMIDAAKEVKDMATDIAEDGKELVTDILSDLTDAVKSASEVVTNLIEKIPKLIEAVNAFLEKLPNMATEISEYVESKRTELQEELKAEMKDEEFELDEFDENEFENEKSFVEYLTELPANLKAMIKYIKSKFESVKELVEDVKDMLTRISWIV